MKNRNSTTTEKPAAANVHEDAAAVLGAETLENMPVTFEQLMAAVDRLIQLLKTVSVPPVWDYMMIAEWMKLAPSTVKLRVITRSDFPPPFVPTGKDEGQKRWFAHDVIAWAAKIRDDKAGS